MDQQKINNFTNGGSDSKPGRMPSGSDTRVFYRDDRDPSTGTFAVATEKQSADPHDKNNRVIDDRNKPYVNHVGQ